MNSGKECLNCEYYVAAYCDYNYDPPEVRPACSFREHYSHVSHNPANSCKYYEESRLKKLEKLYDELFKLVEPRLLSEFCGYNEETHSFDIILALKEILEYLENEKERA